MAQVRAERPSFTFNKGLMTDSSPLTFPPDFSVEELNFELMLDGTRRRRRGLAAETAANISEVQAADAPVRSFKWRAVGDDPTMNLHVWQIGSIVYFADDVPTPSASMRNFTIDLTTLAVEGYEAEVGLSQIDMAFGRGHALIVGKYIEPSYIIYDPVTDAMIPIEIQIKERDFQGVNDGIDNVTFPTVLTDPYVYNMINSGWAYGDLVLYEQDKHTFPAKNMIYYQGFRRETVAGYNPQDGTRKFSSDKLIAELFQDAPAPKGHFIQNPFDTTVNLEVDSETLVNTVVTFSPASPNGLNLPGPGNSPTQSLVTLTFSNPHFLSVGETFDLFSNSRGKIGSKTGDGNRWWTIGGYGGQYDPTVTAEAILSPTQVQFYLTMTDDHAGWRNNWQYAYYPQVISYTGGAFLNIEGRIIDERPTATAFFAGRAWYAGVPNTALSSALFFSQVVEADAQYGKCYQIADPTDENISDLIPTDGGVLRIPEMGRVYKLLPFSSSLLVYASNGVWEVGPGASGYFTATAYSVRKITDTRVVNATSIVDAEGVPIHWARSGIFALVQDTNTGFLTAASLSAQKIDTLYASLGEATRATVTADFDTINKRVVWVYQNDGESNALLFDTKFQAFTAWNFGAVVADIFTTTDYTAGVPTALRFIVQYGSTPTHQVAVPKSLDFQDYGSEMGAYLLTGFDTANSPAKRKQAPLITVFMKRTENVLDGASTVGNASDLTMQARWDWADNSVAGKWGDPQQVYRHPREFTIAEGESIGPVPDGAPLVVTRNKVRGRGRALNLLFEAGTGGDAHILGWSTNFVVLTKE